MSYACCIKPGWVWCVWSQVTRPWAMSYHTFKRKVLNIPLNNQHQLEVDTYIHTWKNWSNNGLCGHSRHVWKARKCLSKSSQASRKFWCLPTAEFSHVGLKVCWHIGLEGSLGSGGCTHHTSARASKRSHSQLPAADQWYLQHWMPESPISDARVFPGRTKWNKPLYPVVRWSTRLQCK